MPKPRLLFSHIYSRHGSVLILVLAVLATLTMLAITLTYRVRLEMKMTQAYAQNVQAWYLAQGGIERARVHLMSREMKAANMGYFHSLDITADEENLFGQLTLNRSKPPKLWVHLRDEESLLNLNHSDPARWSNFEVVDENLAAAVLDWIDSDDQPEPQGTELDYYQQLDHPYQTKNKPILLPRELLYVKDVTVHRYVGRDERQTMLDGTNRDDFFSGPSEMGLLDLFTVYGSGKINLNTVSEPILASLAGLDEQVAATVISFRDGPDQQLGTEDDGVFEHPEDIDQLEELSALQRELLMQYVHFESQFFRVFSRAKVGSDSFCTLSAILQLDDKGAMILTQEKLPR